MSYLLAFLTNMTSSSMTAELEYLLEKVCSGESYIEFLLAKVFSGES